MDKFLRSNLERFLCGQMGQTDRREFTRRLKRSPRCQAQIEEMACISKLFRTLDQPEGDAAMPSPGFARNVVVAIEAERKPELWDVLLQPLFLRRVAAVSCAWLLCLVSAVAYDSTGGFSLPDSSQVAGSFRSMSPASAPAGVALTGHVARSNVLRPLDTSDYLNVRLGSDLERNRTLMLAAVMVSGHAGR